MSPPGGASSGRAGPIRAGSLGLLEAVVMVVLLAGCTGPSPAAGLGPRSPATRSAQAVLSGLDHGDLAATVPVPPCSTVHAGAIGPLAAPYTICALASPEGHVVRYQALGGSPAHGIAFSDRGPQTFLDQCYQHLTGQWWAWRAADLQDPAAPCPGGWHFHGGP